MITYPVGGVLNVFTNALVKSDTDFDPNIRSKSWIFKIQLLKNCLQDMTING